MALRVGTDCSGIDTPLTVFKRLGIDVTHAFSSDSDPSCRDYIARNHTPLIVYESVFARPLHCGHLDVYICGPPCTAASGLNMLQSESGRDRAFGVGANCLDLIASSRPHLFIIENVPRLRTARGGVVFREWMSRIDPAVYEVQWQTLNARDYGCPQNRNRLYIVGVRKDNPHGWHVRFPTRQELVLRASDLMDGGCTAPGLTRVQHDMIHQHIRDKDDVVLNIEAVKFGVRMRSTWKWKDDRVSSCLTAMNPRMYSTKHRRTLLPAEHARLQGFRDGEVDIAHAGVLRMLGNAMNATVLERLLRAVMQGDQAVS